MDEIPVIFSPTNKNSSLTILSTIKLSPIQKETLKKKNIQLIEYDAIEIEYLNFELPQEIPNAIFTSKNAIKALHKFELKIKNCFCVGLKTKKLLEKKGLNVVEVASSASELGSIILKSYKTKSFIHFCGNLRRKELSMLLRKNNIYLEERIVYNTHLKTKKWNRTFDGILFFSPSGVQSYMQENNLKKCVAFSIGNTTAAELRKHTSSIVVSNLPTIEGVLAQVIKYSNNKIN